MSFLAVKKADISHGVGEQFKVHFSPPPADSELPAVWLDLHIAGDYYHLCEDDSIKRRFKEGRDGAQPYVKLPPKKGIRLYTIELVGTDCQHVAVVTNIASKAKHGIILAPGKIDPGFPQKQLVLVVFNQSNSNVILHVGDKIAALAFAGVDEKCEATKSKGHVEGELADYDSGTMAAIKNWLASRDYAQVCFDLLKLIVATTLTLIGAWICFRNGWLRR